MGKDVLYEAMKVAAKQRKIKASLQYDLYKKDEPYFYCAFYDYDFFIPMKKKLDWQLLFWILQSNTAALTNLRWGIIQPGNNLKFTDKVRANSIATCKAPVVQGYPGSLL